MRQSICWTRLRISSSCSLIPFLTTSTFYSTHTQTHCISQHPVITVVFLCDLTEETFLGEAVWFWSKRNSLLCPTTDHIYILYINREHSVSFFKLHSTASNIYIPPFSMSVLTISFPAFRFDTFSWSFHSGRSSSHSLNTQTKNPNCAT